MDVDNIVLYNKLINIVNKKPSNKKMPSFEFKKDIMTAYKKKEIVNMAQENLHMFKRLKEKTSHYDFVKYDKEYDKAQYYKRSHCSLLPSIDFNKNKRNISLGSKSRSMYHSYFNNINNNNSASFNFNTSNSNNINSNNNEQKLFSNNLYKKKLEEFKYEDFVDIKNDNNNDNNENKKENEKKIVLDKKEENEVEKNNKEVKENNDEKEIIIDNNKNININKEEESKNEEMKKEEINKVENKVEIIEEKKNEDKKDEEGNKEENKEDKKEDNKNQKEEIKII